MTDYAAEIAAIEKENGNISSLLSVLILNSIKLKIPSQVVEPLESFLKKEIDNRCSKARELSSMKAFEESEAIISVMESATEKPVETTPEKPVENAYEEDIATAHKALSSDSPVMPGQIFYSSWGYEQTNIDFYMVLSLTPTGKSAKVVQIGSKSVYNHSRMTSVEFPDPSKKTSDVMTKRIKSSGSIGPFFHLKSYSNAYRWDGYEKHASHYA